MTLSTPRSQADQEALKYTDLSRLEEVRWPDAPAHITCTGAALENGVITCVAGAVLQITVAAQTPETKAFQPTHLVVPAGADVILIEERLAAENSLLETKLSVSLGKGATLLHVLRVNGAAGSFILGTGAVEVPEGANYQRLCVLTGEGTVRLAPTILLTGTQSQGHLYALILGRKTAHNDITAGVYHKAENTLSRQHVRMVLDDSARGVFKGAIHVAEGAQKTDAHQISRALLLSPRAEAMTKPELEIFADDVKCGHGSAMGALDDDALFYLQARGVPKDEAHLMLVQAFMTALWPEGLPEAVLAPLQESAARWCDQGFGTREEGATCSP